MIVGLFCSILPNFHENEVSVGGKVQHVLGSSAVKTRWKTLGLCEAHPGQNILPESTRVSKVKQKPFQKILYKKKETRSFISWSVILWSLTFLLKRSVETEHQNQQKYIFPHVFLLLWPVMQLNTPCYSFTSPWGGKKKKKTLPCGLASVRFLPGMFLILTALRCFAMFKGDSPAMT